MPLVIFDLDNTLVDRAASFRAWAEGLVSRLGLDPAEVAWLTAADGDGFTPRPEYLSAVRDRYGWDRPLDALLDEYRRDIVAAIGPDPAVNGALDRLRAAGWRVAIATNGDTDQQWNKIRRAGLDGRADGIAVSAEVGCAKPDRRMFEAAAARSGVPLTGAWMVGDCPIRDIGGGRAAGLRTVWMRRGRDWDAAEPPPDATADSIAEAVGVIM